MRAPGFQHTTQPTACHCRPGPPRPGVQSFLNQGCVNSEDRPHLPRASGAHLSLNRMEYYPNGERKRDDVPDLSNNVRVDDSIFGADYTV